MGFNSALKVLQLQRHNGGVKKTVLKLCVTLGRPVIVVAAYVNLCWSGPVAGIENIARDCGRPDADILLGPCV